VKSIASAIASNDVGMCDRFEVDGGGVVWVVSVVGREFFYSYYN
jgi:hypothetical protein